MRVFRLGAALLFGLLCASCSSVGAFIGDNLPAWAGGLPPGTPPRAGAAGYDEYLKSVGHEQATPDISVQGAEPPQSQPAAPSRAPAEPTEAPVR
jgi:hypothetical protein